MDSFRVEDVNTRVVFSAGTFCWVVAFVEFHVETGLRVVVWGNVVGFFVVDVVVVVDGAFVVGGGGNRSVDRETVFIVRIYIIVISILYDEFTRDNEF